MEPEARSAELGRILKQMREQPVKIAPSDRRAKLTNKERIGKLLGETELAAIVVNAPENVAYFSGYYNMDLAFLSREYPLITVWPAEGEPVFICHTMEAGRQYIDPFIQDVRIYARWTSPMKHLADVIAERGWSKSRLGIEKDFFPLGGYEELVKLTPGVELVNCRHLIDEIKMIKTEAEIELLRFAARATEKAIHIAYELARPGDTEKSVADMIGYAITKLGADRVAFNVVASGERIVLGHHFAEEVPLKEGDLFRVDYGGLFSGYWTDIARMAVVGKASDRQRSIYQKVLEIHREMLDGMRPGAVPHQLVAKALKHYDDVGLPPTRKFFGHGIGLMSVHEEPGMRINMKREIEPNMVLCIENGWSDESSKERYHIEDMIVITEDGYELLTDYAPIDEMYAMT